MTASGTDANEIPGTLTPSVITGNPWVTSIRAPDIFPANAHWNRARRPRVFGQVPGWSWTTDELQTQGLGQYGDLRTAFSFGDNCALSN